MLTIETLREYGANVEEGLERCLNDEGFYLGLIPSSLEEGSYTAIETALQKGDLREAFEAAHALKGVLSNLALTPLLQPVSEMTELLRNNTETDYGTYLSQMWEERKKLMGLL